MEEGRQSVMEISKSLSRPSNPIAQLQAQYKDLETGFRCWLSKQHLAVEAAVVTATNAAQGAAIGAFMGTLTADISSSFPTPPPQAGLNPQAMASLKQAQALAGGPLVQARNFAVMTGVNAGISCVMKRIRGIEDVQTSMVAGESALKFEAMSPVESMQHYHCCGLGLAEKLCRMNIQSGDNNAAKFVLSSAMIDLWGGLNTAMLL